MVDYNKIIAASVNLDIDYSLMTEELLKPLKDNQCVPFTYPSERESKIEVTAYSLFLRKPFTEFNYSYRGSKMSNIEEFDWDSNLSILYTRKIIDSLPFKKLGTVRAVYFPNVSCVEHTDWDDPDDKEHTLGLSIIPSLGNTYCEILKDKTYVKVFGNAMLLNDSIRHRVPKSDGIRITVRVFGDLDYTWFDDKIDYKNFYER